MKSVGIKEIGKLVINGVTTVSDLLTLAKAMQASIFARLKIWPV